MYQCQNCHKMVEEGQRVCPYCHVQLTGVKDAAWQEEVMQDIARQTMQEAKHRKRHPLKKWKIRRYRELPKSILILMVVCGILHIAMCLVVIFLGIWVMTH